MPPLLEAHLRAHESPVSPYESLSPFFATDPKNAPITPFVATLPKSLDFKSFRCHTSETPPGGLHNWLTRSLESGLHAACRERSLRISPRSSFLHGSQTGSAQPSNPTPTLSFLFTLSTVNCQLLTNLSRTSHQSPVTSHEQ